MLELWCGRCGNWRKVYTGDKVQGDDPHDYRLLCSTCDAECGTIAATLSSLVIHLSKPFAQRALAHLRASEELPRDL